VNEAIDAVNLERTREQLTALTAAVNRAATVLDSYK
jgi:hypothetical protein